MLFMRSECFCLHKGSIKQLILVVCSITKCFWTSNYKTYLNTADAIWISPGFWIADTMQIGLLYYAGFVDEVLILSTAGI